MKKFCLTMICTLMMAAALGACSKKTEEPAADNQKVEVTKAPDLKEEAQNAVNQLTDLFGGALKDALGEAQSGLTELVDGVKQDAQDAAGAVNEMLDGAKQDATDAAAEMNEALDGAKQDATEAINDAIDGAKQDAAEAAGAVNDVIGDAQNAIDGIGEMSGLIVPEGALADANYAGYVGVWQIVQAEIEGDVMTADDLVEEFLVFNEDKSVICYRWLGTAQEQEFSPDMKIVFDDSDMPSTFMFDQDGYPHTYTIQSMDDYETLTVEESFFYDGGIPSGSVNVYKKLPAYSKDDFTGSFRDDSDNTLEIKENADGSLNVDMDFYRLAAYDGLTGVVNGRGLYINDKDFNGDPLEILISRDGEELSIKFICSEFEYIPSGEVFDSFVTEESLYTVFTVPRGIVPATEDNFSNEDGVWYITDSLTGFTYIVDDETIVNPVDGIGVPDYTVECTAYEWVGQYLADKECGFHADDCILIIVTGEHIDEINTVNDRSFYDL